MGQEVAADQCFLYGVLGVGEVAVPAGHGTEHAGRHLTEEALGGAARCPTRSHLGGAHDLPDLNGLLDGFALVGGGGRRLGRDLERPVQRVDIDDAVAGQQLLGLRIGPVGDDRGIDAIPDHELGLVRTGQPLGIDELAVSVSSWFIVC